MTDDNPFFDEERRLEKINTLRNSLDKECNDAYIHWENEFVRLFYLASSSKDADVFDVRFIGVQCDDQISDDPCAQLFSSDVANDASLNRTKIYFICKNRLKNSIERRVSKLLGWYSDVVMQLSGAWTFSHTFFGNEYLDKFYIEDNKEVIDMSLRHIYKELSFGFYTKEEMERILEYRI